MSVQSSILVVLHDYDSQGCCLADIELPYSKTRIEDFKVKPGPGGGVIVHMPSWMHTHWSYPEVQWSEVRLAITTIYKEKYSKNIELSDRKAFTENTDVCTFYSLEITDIFHLEVMLTETVETISDLQLYHRHSTSDSIQIYMPSIMGGHWTNETIMWSDLKRIILSEYKKQLLGESTIRESDDVSVTFNPQKRVAQCLVDINLSGRKNSIKGFRLKKESNEDKLQISLPKGMKGWKNNKISLSNLRQIISNQFYSFISEKGYDIDDLSVPITIADAVDSIHSKDNNSKQQDKERNEFGKVLNAENSAFPFVPRTVVRLIELPAEYKTNENASKSNSKNTWDLVIALNSGPAKGFGPFEIKLLEWISQLRYLNKSMIQDLIQAGCVSFGWRSYVTDRTINKTITRLHDYNLIEFLRFVTVNDDGTVSGNSHSNMNIITIGKTGGDLLREIGRAKSRYSSFDLIQDGNTVKRYLAANQWLVYWLKNYKDEIGDSYEAEYKIQQKGAKYNGARLYASVTINDCTMIAEPVRRVEEFEIEKDKQQLCEKLTRLIDLFDNSDHLYHGIEEVYYPSRPIIVLVCEDDEHIKEVWNTIKPVLPEDDRQTVWFTQDLRIFNDDKEEERFLVFEDDNPQVIDIDAYFE